MSVFTRNVLILLIFLLNIMLTPTGARADDPRIKWMRFTTPHFVIIHPQRRTLFARKVAAVAEKVHSLITRHLDWTPSSRTVITVTDYTDMANGMAGGFLMNAITVYATGPQPDGELSDYDDWLWILLAHEYTHIVHMDTRHGLPALIDSVFGKWWVPNGIQPSWVLEGFAVYSESRFSTAGRNRASIYDMYMRTATLYGNHLKLSDFSTFYYPRYPHGALVYLYGSRFIKYLAESRDERNLANLSHDYGSRAMPYGVGKAVRNTFGGEIMALYDQFIDHISEKYRDQMAAVRARGVRRGKALTSTGEYTYFPVFDPDSPNTLLFVENDGAHPTVIKRMVLSDDGTALEVRTLVSRVPQASRPAWTDSGVMFSRIELDDIYYSFYDLYEFQGNRVKRLTSGARLSSPAWCRGSVVAVKSTGATTSLVMKRAGSRVWRPLVPMRFMERASLPSWNLACTKVVFTAWRKGGKQDIAVVDVPVNGSRTTPRVHWLTDDRAIDTDPVFSPDGHHIVFSSDRTGIFNIYTISLDTGHLRKLTNVLTGAFSPAVSPDGRYLVYSRYGERGYDLYVMPFDPEAGTRILQAEVRPEAVKMPPIPGMRSRPYVPFPRPRGWMVDVGAAAQGMAGLLVTGFDDLMHHQWQVSGFVDMDNPKNNSMFSSSYVYSGWWVPLEVDATYTRRPKEYVLWDGWYPLRFPYTRDTVSLQMSSFSPLLARVYGSLYGYASLSLWGAFPHTGSVVVPPDAPLPEPPEKHVTPSGTAAVYYMNADTSSNSILSWENGTTVALGVMGGDGYVMGWADWRLRRRLAPYTVLEFHAGSGIARGWDDAFAAGGPSLMLRALPRVAPAGVSLYDSVVHGYPTAIQTGPVYWAADASVVFPMAWILRGFGTLPFYLHRIWGKVYVESASAFTEFPAGRMPLASVGAESVLQVVELFQIPVSIHAGMAWPLTEGGGFTMYWTLGTPDIGM